MIPEIIILLIFFSLYLVYSKIYDKEKKIRQTIEYNPIITELDKNENYLLQLINDYRVENGLNKLIPEKLCTELALEHTVYIWGEKKASHEWSYSRKSVLFDHGATLFAENVSSGFKTIEGIFNGYMNSNRHREIIGNKNFTHIGISSIIDNEKKKYNTLIFCKF